MTYKDFGPGAPYAATCTSHSEYLETCDRVSPWSAVSGWQLETVTFDTMHVIWLGIARDLFPSALKLLRLWGFHYKADETTEEFLRRTSLEMKETCKRHGPLFTISGKRVVCFCESFVVKGDASMPFLGAK